MDKNLPRWIFQSVAEHFRPVAEDLSLPYFVEGVDERSEETMHSNHVEVRVTGPSMKEVSNGYYTVNVVINFMFTKAMDPVDNCAYDLIQWTGVFADEMLLPVPVYKKGMGPEDNGTLIGCLQIGKGKNEAARIYHFGQLDKDTAVRQSEVDAVFTMDYTGRELGEARVTPVEATLSILAMTSNVLFNTDRSVAVSSSVGIADSVIVQRDLNKSIADPLGLSSVVAFSGIPIREGASDDLGLGQSTFIDIESPFMATWNTSNTSSGSSNASQIQLPLESDGSYNFIVEWGDGNQDTITTWNDAATLHTYNSPGVKTVNIHGQLEGWRFAFTGDRLKIENVLSWGLLVVGDNDGYFRGCSNLTSNAPNILKLDAVTDMVDAFSDCSMFDPPNINNWNTANVINFTSAFGNATVFDQDIGSWDTANATTLIGMFSSATAFNQDIGSWDTANVTNMSTLFRLAENFNQDLGSWNTANVTNMSNLFNGAVAFDFSLATWNIEKVTNMTNMFVDVTLSTANYDSTLIGWEAQTVEDGVNFHGGNSKYSEGTANAARESLQNTSNWVITDGGLA